MKIRLVLNGAISGPHAFFLLAQDRGYFADEDLDVVFSSANGAPSAVLDMAAQGFEAAYGDLNTVIELAGRGPSPIAVWNTFNACPFAIGVRADGPVQYPRDFEGRTVAGKALDAALRTFPIFARATGLDASRVVVVKSAAGPQADIAHMFDGAIDGVFGFVNSIIASASPARPAAVFRFFRYADHAPDLYANALIVRRDLIDSRAAAGLVRAVNRGLVDLVADIDAGLAALHRADPTADLTVQKTRLIGTLENEMADPEGRRLGIGDLDDARLERCIALMVASLDLPSMPRPADVFTRALLPPLAERVRTLPDLPLSTSLSRQELAS